MKVSPLRGSSYPRFHRTGVYTPACIVSPLQGLERRITFPGCCPGLYKGMVLQVVRIA